MTKTKQTAKSISEDIVNILQPDLLFEEYKAKAEGIQVLIDQAITTATQQAVELEQLKKRVALQSIVVSLQIIKDNCKLSFTTNEENIVAIQKIISEIFDELALSQKGSE